MTRNKEITCKDVEKMLYNYNLVKVAIRDIEIEIESVQNEYEGINGSTTNEIKPSTSTNAINSIVESEVENKQNKIDRLQRIKRTKELQIDRVDNMLQTLKDDEKNIIRHIFFDRFSIEKTAAILEIATSTARAKRNLSVSSLANFLNSNK